MNQTENDKIKEMIKDIKFAMLVTTDENGNLHSRPMGTIEFEDISSLWFFASDDSPKILDLLKNEKVNLSYADPNGNSFISVTGTGRVVRDETKIKELWSPILSSWFPKGINDPHICLIEVNPTQVQYWDYPNSKIYQTINLIKEMATGERTHIGENHKVNISQTHG